MARDLRQISAALKMITDMERIGDQAGDISEIIQCADVRKLAEKFDVAAMAQATIQMVNESVDAFVKKVTEATNGKAVIELLGTPYYADNDGELLIFEE